MVEETVWVNTREATRGTDRVLSAEEESGEEIQVRVGVTIHRVTQAHTLESNIPWVSNSPSWASISP